MRKILTLVAIILTAAPAYAQQYKNALQIPMLVQLGDKGNIKKKTSVSYEVRIVSGRPVKIKMNDMIVDSFDRSGYIITSTDSPYMRRRLYKYNKDHEYISSETTVNGKPANKLVAKLLANNTYTESTYFYSNRKQTFNTEVDEIDTISFDKYYRLLSTSGRMGNTMNDYISADTSMTSVFNGLTITTNVVLERDEHGNKTKELSIPEIETDVVKSYLTLYTYEYY